MLLLDISGMTTSVILQRVSKSVAHRGRRINRFKVGKLPHLGAARFALVVALSIWASSTSAVESPEGGPKILPLGDSITDGDAQHDSYRRALWHLLRTAGFKGDFVGSRRLNGYYDDPPPHPDFDQDHEGHSGWTSGDFLGGPSGWDEHRGNLAGWLKS